jgi:multiple sugar transport system substrate-binding protein
VPQVDTPPQAISGGGNGLLRKLLVYGGALLIILLVVFLGKSLFSRVAAPKEVTITYWGLWENDTTVRGMISDFEAKNPTIKVQYIKQSPKQFRERLQSAINRGEGPDAFRFHNTWIPMLHQQLAPVPSTVMTPQEFSSSFFQVANTDLTAGSTIFGIPMMIDGLGLYINQDLFDKAGVTAPVTWTDVLNIVPKLTVKNGTAIVTSAIALGTTGNVEHFSDILALMFLQNGASLTAMSGKEAEQTLVFYRKFADPADPLYTWSDGMDNSVSAFAAGRVAMILAPSWRAHDITQISPQLRFSVVPVPQLPGNSVAWASYWVEGVSARSKNQQAAWEFVKYLTSAEATTKLYSDTAKTRLFGEPYARMEQANAIQDDPYAGAFVKQAVFARSFPLASRTFDNGINDKLIKYLEDAVNAMIAGSSPTQVLQTAASGFRQVLSSYNLIAASTPATK